MGRKGGGRAGFMKAAARKGPDSDVEESNQPLPPPTTEALKSADDNKPNVDKNGGPVISQKAAAFLVGSGDSDDDGSDDEKQERSASGETRGKMVQRHKREIKAMKEQVKRLGKKGKDEAAKLEAELHARHEAELATLVTAPEIDRDATNSLQNMSLNGDIHANSLDDAEPPVRLKKPTKAQRRREQKAERDAEREARIAEELAEVGETERMAEEKELKKILAPMGLAIKDIPPDGHCLYRSLQDQLLTLPDKGISALRNADCDEEEVTFLALRQVAAEYMRKHAEHFMHFIDDGELGETNSFEAYCAAIENTAAWGGHVEIQALSQALKAHIKVLSVGMPVLEVGQEYAEAGGPTLQICYLRHAYGLGEHYNSVMAWEKRVTFEDDDEEEAEEEEEEN